MIVTYNSKCNIVIQDDDFEEGKVYIYIAQLNKCIGENLSQVFVKTKETDTIFFDIGYDGYYTICKLILSTDENERYYYKNNKIYKITGEEASLTEIINLNPEFSNIPIEYKTYFQICKLKRAYIDIASKIITNSDQCNSNVASTDIYKRDLLWSAINAINFLIEIECYKEAQKLLERITSCNGLYDNEINICGCSCGH